MNERPKMSRRAFLTGSVSLAALDSLDLVGAPAFLTAPHPPAPKNTTGKPIYTIGQLGPIPNAERLRYPCAPPEC